jgi:hypothetical protein
MAQTDVLAHRQQLHAAPLSHATLRALKNVKVLRRHLILSEDTNDFFAVFGQQVERDGC